jgi:hypothetical protein
MHEEFNRLLELMNEARQQADEANRIAYDLRQEAVRMQFKATAAADAASLRRSCLGNVQIPSF